MVHQKNYEGPLGGKKDKSGSIADGRPHKETDDHSERKTARISGTCFERDGGDGLENDCLLGMIEGKRARDRQRMKYMDGIKEMVGR